MQCSLHPSLFAVFPSSHPSRISRKPFPHTAVHTPQSAAHTPQFSPPLHMPSPHDAVSVQSPSHPSPPEIFPSSHCSPWKVNLLMLSATHWSTMPSPQRGTVHPSARHVQVLVAPVLRLTLQFSKPRSHC